MEEQNRLKNQLIKHMVYNIIAFAIIFLVFGFLAFFYVRNITFSSVDLELENGAESYTQSDVMVYDYGNAKNIFEYELNEYFQAVQDYALARKIMNPNIIVILRDNNLNVLNLNDLGKGYNQYLKNISFNSNSLNKIYTLIINDNYCYRAINLKLDSGNENFTRYVQLLINVDSEMKLISHYFEIISMLVLMGIAMSILASYILSKKTLIPIAETLKKQTEFVQNASHELRTPLTIIQAKQEMLLQEPNSKIIDKSEEIALTLSETKRLTKLTKDLMILARADDSKLILSKEKVDVDTFIENLCKPYIEMADIENKKLTVNLNCNEEIMIDTNKIYQVMVILLDNALKYTEENDTIQITTSSEGTKCIIEVADTGIGISDESIKYIFDRFYREDKARNRETGGSGLGLSIADVIVKAHNGTIKVMHNSPKGTIFVIKFSK